MQFKRKLIRTAHLRLKKTTIVTVNELISLLLKRNEEKYRINVQLMAVDGDGY